VGKCNVNKRESNLCTDSSERITRSLLFFGERARATEECMQLHATCKWQVAVDSLDARVSPHLHCTLY